jgi:hypothetical protein
MALIGFNRLIKRTRCEPESWMIVKHNPQADRPAAYTVYNVKTWGFLVQPDCGVRWTTSDYAEACFVVDELNDAEGL